MAPTIRIDDDVYQWLQKQAKPFEDTPNSVLKRVANLDKSEDPETIDKITNQHRKRVTKSIKTTDNISGRRLNGRLLNKVWKVGARHALYHKDGHWYNNLQYFPGAYFDPNGYVIFKTEKDYTSCQYLKIGKETNVPKGISSIPGYVRIK